MPPQVDHTKNTRALEEIARQMKQLVRVMTAVNQNMVTIGRRLGIETVEENIDGS